MNKKIKILIFIVIIVGLIPLGYKQFLNNTVVKKITDLNDQGFMVTQQKDDSTYLTTMKTYKIVISNPDTIYQNFLSTFFNNSQKDIVKKFLNTINGGEITAEINILNFPVSHKDAINIYFTALPPKATSSKPNLFLNQIKDFLKNRGLGESISTNAFGKIESVRLKNIDKKFDAKKGDVELRVKDYISKFSKTDFKNYNYAFLTTNTLFDFTLNTNESKGFSTGYKNLKCDATRENLYNYSMSCNVKNFHFDMKKYSKNQTLKLNNILLSTKSALMGDSINYVFKYRIKGIDFNMASKYGKNVSTKIDNFVYSGSVKGINKNIFDELSKISYNSNKYILKQNYLKILQSLLNNGFVFQVDHFDVGSVTVNSGSKPITFGQITTKVKLEILKNNLDLSKRFNPLSIVRYLNLNADITLTKKDFDFIKSLDRRGKMSKIFNLAKEKGDKVQYKIIFKEGKLTVNDKKL